MTALASMFLLGWLTGLASYWTWVFVDWRRHRRRRYYD